MQEALCFTSAKCIIYASMAFFMEAPGERLKAARIRAGHDTAKAAAESMGATVSTYIQHENGSRGFPANTAARYARFFSVKPEWLLYGRGSGDPIAPAQILQALDVINEYRYCI